MNKNQAGKAAVTTVEEFERHRRQYDPRGEEPGFLSRWLRLNARGVLETELDRHNKAVPALADLFNHRAEGKQLAGLFDKVVNGVGREADKAAVYVLARYRLGLIPA